MAVDTVKRNKRQYEWQKENRERLNFVMPKGYKARIQQAADAEGISASEWIRRAIDYMLDEVGM